MKRFFFTSRMLSMLLVLAITFSTISCDEDDDHNPTENIVEVAKKTENLSIFYQTLQLTQLDAILSNSKASFTVFAPTNDAFKVFLQQNPSYTSITNVPVDVLRRLLLNHVINIETYAANLPKDGYLKTQASSGSSTTTLSLYVNKSSGTRLNGMVNVINKDIRATNGVIHVVDGIISLPSLTTHLRANPALGALVKLLESSPATGTSFIELFNNPDAGPFTVFAPINYAFNADAFDALPGDELTADNFADILRYHTVNGKVFSTQLVNGPVNTRLNQTFTVNTTNGVKITDAKSQQINIGTTDIEATNGVIHAVNKVLLPNL